MVYTVPIPEMTEAQKLGFWAKVEATGFCWNWTARKCKNGYGYFNFRSTGQALQAHRISYTVLVGPIPDGLVIDHLCRNTSCVNPDHLEPVTHAENQRRIPEIVRRPSWITSGKNITGACNKGHEYTDDNTYTYKDGRTDCRKCRTINAAEYRARLKMAARREKPAP